MNQNRSGRTVRRGAAAHAAYNYGNTARKPERRARNIRPARDARRNFTTLQGGLTAEDKKASKKSTVINLIIMVGALAAATVALYCYVGIQTSLASSVTAISALEKELATLKQENDEAYSRANATVDLEEVKRMAIQELGMKYADEGQIITYSDDGAADYVRQMAGIPEVGK